FAGVSILEDGKLCPSTTTFVETRSECGYHLLVVQDYSRTKKETPNGHGIASRGFGVGGHRWCINYYPNGENSTLFPSTKHVQACRFVFSFVDQVEKYVEPSTIHSRKRNRNAQIPLQRYLLGLRHLYERSAYLGEDDCFTIRCDIMVCNARDSGPKVLLSAIHHDFNHLLHSKPDIRCVLAARSTIFMAQLFGPTKEGTAAPVVIRIKDMKPKVFKALLSFIYTESFPMMEYDVQRLKCICVKQLSKNMGVLSVMSTLGLAEQHHCQELKEACLKFIQAQPPLCLQAIMATNGWDHVYKTYPCIFKDLIAKLASNQRK
ncbi:hypothetical protein ZWY2020_023959, partial [Hordeum vulgare]